MSNATEKRIRDLHRQLANEQLAHATTRNTLQAELRRWQHLVRPHILDLMVTYPPLRRLLVILAEAADLQDPSRGVPVEDTARTEYVSVGEHASTSQTEAAVLTHRRAREDVRRISRELELLQRRIAEQLEHVTHIVGSWIPGANGEYQLPEPPVCHRKGCPSRGRQQSYKAWWDGCEGCGRSFQ